MITSKTISCNNVHLFFGIILLVIFFRNQKGVVVTNNAVSQTYIKSLFEYLGFLNSDDQDSMSDAWKKAVTDPKTQASIQNFLMRRTFNRLISFVGSALFQNEFGMAVCSKSKSLMTDILHVYSDSTLDKNTRFAILTSFINTVKGTIDSTTTLITSEHEALSLLQKLKSGYAGMQNAVKATRPLTMNLSPSVVALLLTPFNLFLACLDASMRLDNNVIQSVQSTRAIKVVHQGIHQAYVYSTAAGALLSSSSTLTMISSIITYTSEILALSQSASAVSLVSVAAGEYLEVVAAAILFAGYSALAMSSAIAIVSLIAYMAMKTNNNDEYKITSLDEVSEKLDNSRVGFAAC
jgi:hypothetical protein